MNPCGGCTLCCLLTHIPALGKKVYQRCGQCEEGVGCSDYNGRPRACKAFVCVWRDENLPATLRPDRCHIMFERLPESSTYVGLVKPGYENMWLTKKVQKFTDEKLSEGSAVIVSAAGARVIRCPDGVNPDDVLKDLREAYKNYITEC